MLSFLLPGLCFCTKRHMANTPSVSGMIDPAMPKMPDDTAEPVTEANSVGFGAVVIVAIRARSTYAE